MTCHTCSNQARKHGKDRKGHQRYRCESCNKTFIESYERPLDDMRIPFEKAIFALNCLVEGCSIRSTEIYTHVAPADLKEAHRRHHPRATMDKRRAQQIEWRPS